MWTRQDSNFEDERNQLANSGALSATLQCREPFSPVRAIKLRLDFFNYQIQFVLSPFHIELVHTLFKQIFNVKLLVAGHKIQIDTGVSCTIGSGSEGDNTLFLFFLHKDQKTYEKLNSFFKLINTTMKQEIVTHEVIKEINQLQSVNTAIKYNNILHILKPYIPSENNEKSYVHPEKQNSKSLYLCMRENRLMPHHYLVKKIKKMIVSGEDPNQTEESGWGTFHIALEFEENDIFEFLIERLSTNEKSVPFVIGWDGYSVFDQAKKHNKIDKLNIMATLLQRPEKCLSVIDEKHYYEKDKVGFTRQFEDQSAFNVEYKPLEQFIADKKEVEAVYNLYKNTFEYKDNKEEELKRSFTYAFLSGKKIICIITARSSNKLPFVLAGAYLLEPIQSKNNKNTITIHGEYALIDPQFQGSRLNRFILLLLANTAKLVKKDLELGTYYSATNWSSYRLLADGKLGFLCSPRTQSTHSTALIEEVLTVASGNAKTLQHDDMAWHIIESKHIHVKRSAKKSRKDGMSLSEKMFHLHVMQNKTEVYIPVFAPANGPNMLALKRSYQAMNFDVMDATYKIAVMMVVSHLMEHIVGQDNSVKIPSPVTDILSAYDNTHHFFGLKVSMKEKTTSQNIPTLRSKL